jgi:hypothetical protein
MKGTGKTMEITKVDESVKKAIAVYCPGRTILLQSP